MNQDQEPVQTVASTLTMPREVRVVHERSDSIELPIIDGAGTAQALVWPGMGAHLRSMHRVSLHPGGRTVLLRHPMEAVYYVIAGSAHVEDLDDGTEHFIGEGAMFLIDPGTSYRISSGTSGAEVVGGPCPADPQLYRDLETD